jgi:hypothetical protein
LVVFAAPLVAITNAFAQPCGVSPNDWCGGPPGDSCGRHPNAASCKADNACFGLPYRGESTVACQFDTRGFGTNCPTVGCTSVAPMKRNSPPR